MDKVKLLSVSLLLALVVGAGFGVGAVQGARSGTGEYLDSQTQEYVLDPVTRSLHEGEGSRYRETEEESHLFTHVAAATEEIDSGQGASTSDAQEPLEPLWWATLLGDRWEFPWEDGRWHRWLYGASRFAMGSTVTVRVDTRTPVKATTGALTRGPGGSCLRKRNWECLGCGRCARCILDAGR